MSAPVIERPFPIVHPDPSFRQVVSNITMADVLLGGAVAAVSWPLGFLVGVAPFRAKTTWAVGTLGSLTGFMLAFQNSTFRLAGMKDNRYDVARLGTWPENRADWASE